MFKDGTLVVDRKNVTATADNREKAYGDADPELTFSVSGLVGYDT